MATKEEVEQYLINFKNKLNVFSIIFRDDRGKNLETLSILEIAANSRIDYITKLSVEDYSEGPIKDILNGNSDLWVFGTKIKGFEIYIKITIGMMNKPTICISFHIAEHPIKYPYKQKNNYGKSY